MSIRAGATVRLIQPELRGVVLERRIHPETDELEVLVEFDEGGSPVRRWIDADRVEEVTL